jgi:hypothetical protein
MQVYAPLLAGVDRHLHSLRGIAASATLVPVARERGVTLADVREIASQLPRSYEVFVYGRVKFRVGQIVWLAFSRDETEIGFAFPKELRQALVESDPDTYFLPGASDLRFNWVCARLAALERDALRELVEDAWSIVVPKFVAAAYGASLERAAGRD